MSDKKYEEVYKHFIYAEAKIKQIERLNGDGISIPSINQLRYAGQHVLTALNSDDSTKENNNIYEAIDHCKRATYDALEIGILYYLDEVGKFKEDNKYITVTDVISNYIECLKQVKEARDFIEINNRNSLDDEPGDMDARYTEILKHFENLERIYHICDVAREELAKKITIFRRNFLIAMTGIIVTLIGVIVAIVAL